jgi:hypothetical protein
VQPLNATDSEMNKNIATMAFLFMVRPPMGLFDTICNKYFDPVIAHEG